jgi:raffinose/stachyose/melibiose transport system permease protein
MAFVAAMVIPFQVVMFPLVRWLRILGGATGIPLLGTYQASRLRTGVWRSMSIFILHGFIKGVPLELEEAATIDGCGQAPPSFASCCPFFSRWR